MAGRSPVGTGPEARPGGAERGPAGESPAAAARASRPSLGLGKQHGDPPPPPRHPAHAPLSNQNGSSPGPWAGGGTPLLSGRARKLQSPRKPWRSGAERGPFPARKGLGRRKGRECWRGGWRGASSLGHRGPDLEGRPRGGHLGGKFPPLLPTGAPAPSVGG